MNKDNAEAIVQNLLNKVGALEYQNTLLQVENDRLKNKGKSDGQEKVNDNGVG